MTAPHIALAVLCTIALFAVGRVALEVAIILVLTLARRPRKPSLTPTFNAHKKETL